MNSLHASLIYVAILCRVLSYAPKGSDKRRGLKKRKSTQTFQLVHFQSATVSCVPPPRPPLSRPRACIMRLEVQDEFFPGEPFRRLEENKKRSDTGVVVTDGDDFG